MYMDNVLAVPAAILHNPTIPTPSAIAEGLRLLRVMHYDFAGTIKIGEIVIHQLVLADVRAFFAEAFALRFPIHSIIPVSAFNWQDEDSCLANNSSGHNMRYIEGESRLSKHAIGCAFDINPTRNPCYVLDEITGRVRHVIPWDGTYVQGSLGTLSAEHPLVALMISRGWSWGGNWTFPKDYQHFQIVPPELASYVT